MSPVRPFSGLINKHRSNGVSRALIVFAKEPMPGVVKTRLRGCFPDAGLVRLYKAFVKDTLAIAREVKGARRILAFSSTGEPWFLKSIGRGFELIGQEGRTLGKRMYNAFVYADEKKPVKAVIIGTDSPTLPARIIERAFHALNHKDVVIGPSVDGGYYLIGMNEPHADVFKGVHWSSALVLKKTLAKAKASGVSTALLDEWYDVDGPLSLKRLQKDLKNEKNFSVAKHTRQALKHISIIDEKRLRQWAGKETV